MRERRFFLLRFAPQGQAANSAEAVAVSLGVALRSSLVVSEVVSVARAKGIGITLVKRRFTETAASSAEPRQGRPSLRERSSFCVNENVAERGFPRGSPDGRGHLRERLFDFDSSSSRKKCRTGRRLRRRYVGVKNRSVGLFPPLERRRGLRKEAPAADHCVKLGVCLRECSLPRGKVARSEDACKQTSPRSRLRHFRNEAAKKGGSFRVVVSKSKGLPSASGCQASTRLSASDFLLLQVKVL